MCSSYQKIKIKQRYKKRHSKSYTSSIYTRNDTETRECNKENNFNLQMCSLKKMNLTQLIFMCV